MNLEDLNKKYLSLSPKERIKQLYEDFGSILLTSSFGTTSVYLLHLFHEVQPQQTVHFLDTTYHFKETLAYKEELTNLLGLQVKNVLPEEWKNKFTQEDHTWHKDPDLCCAINKVEPMERIKANHEVWVSGLMSWQNKFRSQLNIFEEKKGIIKFYPIIDVEELDMQNYLSRYRLPPHPLQSAGYSSIGCIHCTRRGKGREGRWSNKAKTECGLHL